MNSKKFRDKIIGCDKIDLCRVIPWSDDGYYGFVKRMDDYRRNKLFQGPYSKNSPLEYVQFLSGLFVHEAVLQVIFISIFPVLYIKNVKLYELNSLQGSCSVYQAVIRKNPEVFVKLYKMVPRPSRTVL